MEESQEVNQHNHEGEPAPTGINRAILIVAAVLLAVGVVAVGYGYRQQVMVGHLTAQGSAASATINDMQGQLTTLTSKLNDMSAAQQAAAEAAAQKKAQAGHAATTGPKSATRNSRASSGKQLKELRAQLDAQQKLPTHTQPGVAKNRSDLEGKNHSTRHRLHS